MGLYTPPRPRDSWPSPLAWQMLTQEARDIACVIARLTTDYHWAPDAQLIKENHSELCGEPGLDLAQVMTHIQALTDAGFALDLGGTWALHHQAVHFLTEIHLFGRVHWVESLPQPGLLLLNSSYRETRNLDELIPWAYGDLVHTVTELDDLSVLGATAGDRVVLRLVHDPNEHDYEDISDAMPRSAWGKPLRLQRWTEDAMGYRLVAHIRLGNAAQGKGSTP